MKQTPRILEVMQQLEIRKWDGDLSFVYSSWLRSFIGNSSFSRGVPTQWVYRYQAAVIGQILGRSAVYVLSLSDDPDVIIGYVVGEKGGERALIHYVYVKKAYQNMGVAGILIDHIWQHLHVDDSLSMIATHSTDAGRERLMRRHGLIYNPYLIFMEPISGNDETEKSGAGKRGARWHETPGGKVLPVRQV